MTDAIPSRAAREASYWAGYEHGRAHAEQSALMVLAWIVEDAGGELAVTPKMTLRRVERIDSPTTDQFVYRLSPNPPGRSEDTR
jgi:hypothetical protein